jgi:CubicO group peptidase (beta-lactamase class C family)
LPRLPPNLQTDSIDPSDPYANYRHDDLLAALRSVAPGIPKYEYSNFGFMTLGAALSAATGRPIAELLGERVFDPGGMTSSGCPPSEDRRLPGYAGATETPWWTTHLPGAGGVGASIRDVAAYVRAHIEPAGDVLGTAIRRATTIHATDETPMGYGWVHQGGGWWHNGATGGFRSFIAFHRESTTGVALLANGQQAEMIDSVGFATLTEMIKQA